MARMGREFSLVLLGSGVLTTGYFLFQNSEELKAKEEEQIREQVGQSHGRYYHGTYIFYHGGSYSSTRSSPSMGSHVASRGFGGIGRASAGG